MVTKFCNTSKTLYAPHVTNDLFEYKEGVGDKVCKTPILGRIRKCKKEIQKIPIILLKIVQNNVHI